jgi:chorismate mutase/prephenate dehydratase
MDNTSVSPLESLKSLDRELLNLIRKRSSIVTTLHEQGTRFHAADDNAQIESLLQDTVDDASESMRSSLRQTMRSVAAHCRHQLATDSVSFLGPLYSYSHLAAIKYFGDSSDFAPVASIPAVFDAVRRGDSKAGLVPIENSTDGRVVDTLGMFVRRHMQICGEVLLPIHHNLLASGSREQITEIHSKPQALSQCRGWLASNFPTAQLIEVSSTTAAAESASKHQHIAAVASLPAGQAYGLDVLNRDIEDQQDNVTRFAVLGQHDSDPTGKDKTSLLFQVEHEPGALAQAMRVFEEAELNLTWIESFPAPGARNEYLFFIEFTGHRRDAKVIAAIERLSPLTRRLEILGSYPVARI